MEQDYLSKAQSSIYCWWCITAIFGLSIFIEVGYFIKISLANIIHKIFS